MNRAQVVSVAALALCLLELGRPVDGRAQGYRGELGSSISLLQIQRLSRDSLPESQVAGQGLRRRLPDGTIVSCTPGEFCRWFRAGPVEDISIVTQQLRLAAWGPVRGLSVHAQLRGRYGTDDFWPRSNQKVDALSAYLNYDRGDFRARAGRLVRTDVLGYYNLDGAAFLWRSLPALRVELFGGWSLGRGLDQPRDGTLLAEADEFAPDRRSYVLGAEVGGRWGRRISGSVMYEREIRTDRLALLTERVGGELRALAGNVTVDLSAKYDVAFDQVNEARVRVSAPIVAGLEFTAHGRHYTPFFELWTIWPAFSPVGFNEGGASLVWRDRSGMRLEAGGAYRSYDDPGTGLLSARLKDYGWRILGRGSWNRSGWFIDGGYRAETGFGSVRYGGDGALGYAFGPGTFLSFRGSSTQTFGEFEIGEQFTNGGGVDGALRIGDLSVRGGWAAYRLTYDNRPSARDWTQHRFNLGFSYRFGTEPGGGKYR